MAKRKAASGAGAGKKAQKVIPKVVDYTTFYPLVMDEVFKLVDDEDDRELAAPFVKLPSKKLYPDYYTIVKSPITIGEIQKRAMKNHYPSDSLDEFIGDFQQLYDNAALYNDPDLWLVGDALEILNYIKEEAEKWDNGEGLSQPNVEENPLDDPEDDQEYMADIESTETLSNQTLSKVCESVILALIKHEFPGEGIISAPFLEIVDRKEFPDYFQVISDPMSFNKILKNLRRKTFFLAKKGIKDNLEYFHRQTSLIWKNAQSYNDPLSLIYQDSAKLLKYFEEIYEKIRERLPERYKTTGPKLKLKLGRPRKFPLDDDLVITGSPTPGIKSEDHDEEGAGEGDDGSEDDDSQDEIINSKDVPVLENEYSAFGKTSNIPDSSDNSFVQLLSFCLNADFSSSSFLQKLEPRYRPLGSLLPSQQLKHALFPAGNVSQPSTSYEYHFLSSGYESSLYSLTLPPNSLLQALFRVSLHKVFYELKKSDVFNQGVVTLDEEFLCNLTVNEEPVIGGGHIYDDISSTEANSDKINSLNFQYDIKLGKGLNIVTFEIKVAPSLSKKLGNVHEDDEGEGTGRHTRNQLQQFKMSWDVQKVNFSVIVN